MSRTPFTVRRLLASVGLLSATLIAGCGGQAPHPADAAAAGGLPSTHVHAVDINPGDGRVYLATHEGLFRYDASGAQRVGPVIDLMGFTVAGPNHFYASGHPAGGTDLPDPVGLIESTDGGQTWTALSRQGESDFHALTASSGGMIAGYDGDLAVSTDGVTWDPRVISDAPYALAASPDGAVLLATTSTGLLRSVDTGRGWESVPNAPPLILIDWADTTVAAGITQNGTIANSTDGGMTWQLRGTVGPPQAIAAASTTTGTRLVVATETELLNSTDGGVTFSPLPG